MIEINREAFEAWLFAQPERSFVYTEGHPDSDTGCLLCNFLRETQNRRIAVGHEAFFCDGEPVKIPRWALSLSRLVPLNIPNVQQAYIAAFGDPRLPDLCATKPAPAPHPAQCPLETNSGEVAEAGPVNFR